ncbi:MAG: hypothetical protein ACRD2C_25600 [Acidimicrobiales bacterium]
MPDVRPAARVRRWLDDTLWGPETGAHLVVVQVGLVALIGLRVVLGSYRQLAETPSALVDPVPFLFWLDRMPSVGAFVALQVIGGAAAVVAVVAFVRSATGRTEQPGQAGKPGQLGLIGLNQWVPRVAYAVAWACYLVLAGLRGSRGKVLHNDLLLVWASAPFLLAPLVTAAGWRDRVRRRVYGWPIRVSTVVIALVYGFAGYHKLRRSGIDWVVGDNMRYVMLWGPSVGQAAWEGMARWVGEHLWAARASAAFILGLEITFPLVLVYRRLQPVYAAAVVFLHITTWFVLGLDYWAWALAVPLVLVDWPAVVLPFRPPSRRDEALTDVGRTIEGAVS